MPFEREVKLRFPSVAEARARVLALHAAVLRERRLQRDFLLDDERQSLKARGSALRVRNEAGAGYVTFKGPAQPGTMKLRQELETQVGDADTLLAILHATGFAVWFRYEKFREEFSAGAAVIAIDETPIGVFIEIEGPEHEIHQLAQALGLTPSDYVTESYHQLFVQHRQTGSVPGTDMVFAASGG